MLEQLGHGASTGLVHVENQGKGHVGHRCGFSAGYWSSVTISTSAPAELAAVVRPHSRTPVAVATGLRGQQVE